MPNDQEETPHHMETKPERSYSMANSKTICRVSQLPRGSGNESSNTVQNEWWWEVDE